MKIAFLRLLRVRQEAPVNFYLSHFVKFLNLRRISNSCLMASGGNTPDNQVENSTNRKRRQPKNQYTNRPAKKERTGFSENHISTCEYHKEHGLRFVKPYLFQSRNFAKGRWLGRKLTELMLTEFSATTIEYLDSAIKMGRLKINDKSINEETCSLKNGDIVTHIYHRHEPPVLDTKIDILYRDEHLLVINKPSSIPVYPAGRFRGNTIMFILGSDYGIYNLKTIHRLDRLTSGVLMFALSKEKAIEIQETIQSRKVIKEYLCLVEGEFPDEITVNEPILAVNHNIGVCRVDAEGKSSSTHFQKLKFNGKYSLVKCWPRTGRMHQIRVHLQWLGFPIMNDPIYNHPAWELPKFKGPNPTSPEKMDYIIKVLAKEIKYEENQSDKETPSEEKAADVKFKSAFSYEVSDKLPNDFIEHHSMMYAGIKITQEQLHKMYSDLNTTPDPICTECSARKNIPQMFMYLHALKYSTPDWEYSTDWPPWATDFIKHEEFSGEVTDNANSNKSKITTEEEEFKLHQTQTSNKCSNSSHNNNNNNNDDDDNNNNNNSSSSSISKST